MIEIGAQKDFRSDEVSSAVEREESEVGGPIGGRWVPLHWKTLVWMTANDSVGNRRLAARPPAIRQLGRIQMCGGSLRDNSRLA